MGSPYSSRQSRPTGASDKSFGGAGLNLGLNALCGESNMVTTFDDFDGIVTTEEADSATNYETLGWAITEDGTVANVGEEIGQNDPANVDTWMPSCLVLNGGTADNSGFNMQLVHALHTSGGPEFPYLWIPEETSISHPQGSRAALGALDETTWVFACRIGLKADDTVTGAGAWDSSFFIGWAASGDTSIMTHDTGALTIASDGPLIGFHVPVLGGIHGISHRTEATAMAEGVNFTAIVADGGVDGTVANGAAVAGDTMWFDLALRMHVTDMSLDAGCGWTTFYTRGPLNKNATTNPGLNVGTAPGEGYMPWTRHTTVLDNQTPSHTAPLVPTLELITGATAGVDPKVYLDWWAMGCSRVSY